MQGQFKFTFCNLETEVLTPESPEDRLEDIGEDEPIKPYEKRALNFLVNEYLLLQDYKLTSVTFSEENENQVSVFFVKRKGKCVQGDILKANSISSLY